jgi:hypothetical protein
MIKIDLSTLRIPQNIILVKPDDDFKYIELKPQSELSVIKEPVILEIGYDPLSNAKHYSITGKILAVPERLIFNKKQVEKIINGKTNKNITLSDRIAISELREASLDNDVDMELIVEDKVWFEYLSQVTAITENLVVDVKDHGLCFFIRYDRLYSYQRNEEEMELINGWIWIQKVDAVKKTETGIDLELSESNQFKPNLGMIVKASNPVRNYLETYEEGEDLIGFNGGEQVVYDGRFGYEAEYDTHRKLNDKPTFSIKRKHIIAVL